MTQRLLFVFGILYGLAIGYLLWYRTPPQTEQDEPVGTDWERRLDSLHSFYQEETATTRLGRAS